MEYGTLAMYAVWISSKKDHGRSFMELWESIFDTWNFPMSDDDDIVDEGDRFFTPFLKLGDGFYLLYTESHWSPGDICGFLRHNNLLAHDEEMMAVRCDPEYYVPHHGLLDENRKTSLSKWLQQVNHIQLVRRSNPRR